MTSDDDNWFSDYEDPVVTKRLKEIRRLEYNDSLRKSFVNDSKTNKNTNQSNEQVDRDRSDFISTDQLRTQKDAVVIIKALNDTQEPMIKEILVNSNIRTKYLKETEFKENMHYIKEIKINKEKKQMVIILKPGINKESLEKLYNVQKLGPCEVECRPPIENNTKTSVIQGYPTQSSLEDLERNLKEAKLEYKKVIRLNKHTEGEKRPTESILVEFLNYAPKQVFIDYCRYNVKPYIPQPLRCYKCQRFGHIAIHCKSKTEKCAICGSNHRSQDCVNKNNSKCANCGDNHPAYSKQCESYLKAKDIRKVQDARKTSYATAARIIRYNENEPQEPTLPNRLNNRIKNTNNHNAWTNNPGPSASINSNDNQNWPPLPTQPQKFQEKIVVREIATQTDENEEENNISEKTMNKEKLESVIIENIKETIQRITKEAIQNLIYEIIESLMPTSSKNKNSKKQVETLLENFFVKMNQNDTEKNKRKLSESPSNLAEKSTSHQSTKPENKKPKKHTSTSTWIL